MNSTLSSARSWLSAGHWQSKPSNDATLVPDDPNLSIAAKNKGFLGQLSWLDKLAIALVVTFCGGVLAALTWQSSRQIASVPQSAPAPATLSPLKEQLETISSGLAAIRQSVDGLTAGLGQMRRDITNLQTSEQALFDRISEPPPRPAVAQPAKPLSRASQAPPGR